jgi:2-aminobenzoate-CoA ligase
MATSAHVDTFARDHLPPPEALPEFIFELPGLQLPAQLNCAEALLDARVAAGDGERLCIQGAGVRWTYAELQQLANRIARVLVDELGLVPGNRVLLRGANSPMLAACWFGVVKAGGIAVGTMPLLRAKELGQIIDKAQVTHALCDARLADDLSAALTARPPCGTCCTSARPARWTPRCRWKHAAPGSRPTSTPCPPQPTTPA